MKRLQSRVNEENSIDGKTHNASDQFSQFTMRLENSVNVTSYLFFNDPFKASQRKTIVESVENFQEAFLTIHELQACSEEVTVLKKLFKPYFNELPLASPNSNASTSTTQSFDKLGLRGFKHIFAFFGARTKYCLDDTSG